MALRRLEFACAATLIAATAVQVVDAVRVGALRFISSSALFVAEKKGFFRV